MTTAKKDFALLTEVYDSMNTPEGNTPMGNTPMGSTRKVGDIINGHDGEEVIISIQDGSIYTRVLTQEGNVYTEEDLSSMPQDEAEEEGGGEGGDSM